MDLAKVFLCLIFVEQSESHFLGSLPKDHQPLHFISNQAGKTKRENLGLNLAVLVWNKDEFSLRVNFTALHKRFCIYAINPKISPPIFSDRFIVEVEHQSGPSRWMTYKHLRYFVGSSTNIFGSSVRGYLSDGVFTATINTPEDVYYIEPSSKFFNSSQRFNAVVYRQSSVLSNACDGERCIFEDMQAAAGPVSNETKRVRRSPDSTERWSHIGRVCGLHVILDHTFIRFHKNVEANSVEAAVLHVEQATKYFQETDFNHDGSPDGVGFEIEKMSLFDFRKKYFLSNEHMTIENILQELSVYAAYQPPVCLFVCFVSRDFRPHFTIGLAYVGDPNSMGPSGGICETPVMVQGIGMASTNAAVITTLNNDKPQTSAVVSITLTHEIGHSFGSPHDTDSCSPGPPDGHYIMYPTSSDPVLKNNKKFSPCSIDTMLPVIRNKGSCLRKPKKATCGDSVIQEGEECDCGSKETCSSIDPCCIPANDTAGRTGCTIDRRRGYKCSPMNQQCCTRNCDVEKDKTKKCSSEQRDCRLHMTCNGKDAGCSTSEPKKDFSPCARNSKTCKRGECISTVCRDHGLKDCDCTFEDNMCDVCCTNGTMPCISATLLGFSPIGGGSYRKLPGTTCNGSKSYCDTESKCVPLDAEGMMDAVTEARRKQLLDRIGLWAVNHWYYIFLGASFLLLVFLVLRGVMSNQRQIAEARNFHNAVKKARKRLQSHPKTNLPEPFLTVSSRLVALFPDVPVPVVLKVARRGRSEKGMVKALLSQGYPMKTCFLGAHETSEAPDRTRPRLWT